MPRYKKTASRLKDPSRFHSYHAEEKYEEFIEPRRILEEKGFQFPDQLTGIVQTIHNVVAKRGWLEFCNHPRDLVLPVVKEFYANLVSPDQPTTHTTTVSQEMLVLLYVIVRGLPIDIGSIFAQEIQDCAVKTQRTAALLFPSLVTSICVVLGVRLDTRDEHV